MWNGSGLEGSGVIGFGSGVLSEVPYSFAKRFGDEPGTNPEELVAAAHAACFSMALSFGLGNAGHAPERISTNAALTLNKADTGWKIEGIHLTVKAKVPGMDAATFADAAKTAKETCPISRLLNTAITMDATLEE